MQVDNHSIANNESQNSLRDWLSMEEDRDINFNRTCIDDLECSRSSSPRDVNFANATYPAGCDAPIAPLSSTMIDLLALGKGEKIRKQVSTRYASIRLP